MHIELSAEDQATVTTLLQSGRYSSPGQVIHDGLEQLRDELSNTIRIRTAMQEAIESVGRGEIVRGDDFLNELAERRLHRA